MNKSNWKGRERQVAKFFGTERTPLSGGNSKHTRSDTLHEHLFVECKQRKVHAAVKQWYETALLARKENKIPVVCLSQKGKPGFFILVHSSDLLAVANQRALVK
jgi:hypothetical protein